MVKKSKSKSYSASKSASNNETKEEKEENNTQSTFLNECDKAFGSKDLYTILGLNKSDATQSDIKKAYYRLSLKYHPDKCEEEALKEDCNFKFQLLGRLYSILSDEEKKKLYDDCGIIDGEDEENNCDWATQWRTLFKKITVDDIKAYFNDYKGSQQEKEDLFKVYKKNKGDMTKIMQEINSEDAIQDEQRFKIIINEAINKGELESFEIFLNEDKKKAAKRHAKYEKEAAEAEELQKEIFAKMPKTKLDGSEDSLMLAIQQNSQRRHNDLLSSLTEKYCKKNGKQIKKKQNDNNEENEQSEAEVSSEDEEETASSSRKRSSKNLKSKPSIKRKVKRL